MLPSVPGSNVTVTLDPDRNSGDFRLNAAAAGDSIDLIFTTGNWDSVQTVTVEAVSDADTVYREHGDMLISSLSGDSDYNLGLFDIVAVNIPDTNLSSDESGMLQSSTWVATDDLGRDLPTYEEVGPPKSDKTVALFYFLWLGEHGQGGPYDITKILEADPCNPAWGGVPAFHHWGESELGYYLSSEEYVMRKHVQLLNYAGVDVLVFDGTNGNPYLHNVLKLCKVLEDVKTEDGKCPKIAWFTYNTVQQLYDEFYSVNKYPDLWYYWEGKPLILGEDLTGYSAEIQNFFSRKALGAWAGGEDLWTWTDWTPQRFGWDSSPDTAVQTAVAVAMQETYMSNTSTAHGRHFENEYGPDGTEPDSQYWDGSGTRFADQWFRALRLDPEYIHITGWNEWVAQWLNNVTDADFTDAYTQEFNRDVEPMKDGHTDNYYYQMIDGIRRFKGALKPDDASVAKTITIDGLFSDWDDVGPDFRDARVDTTHRGSAGWGSAGPYINTTGRSDILSAKVTRESAYVYFYVVTTALMTPYTDSNWM